MPPPSAVMTTNGESGEILGCVFCHACTTWPGVIGVRVVCLAETLNSWSLGKTAEYRSERPKIVVSMGMWKRSREKLRPASIQVIQVRRRKTKNIAAGSFALL